MQMADGIKDKVAIIGMVAPGSANMG